MNRRIPLTLILGLLMALACAPAWAQDSADLFDAPTGAAPVGASVDNNAPAGAAAVDALSSNSPLMPSIRVQLEPVASTTLAARMPGTVDAVAVRDGERFEEGQVLVSMDCTVPEGELARAQAVYATKREVRTVTQSLYELRSRSALELAVAQAEANEAWAEVELIQALVDRCQVTAPFSGVAGETMVREHQYVAEGEPLLQVLDDSQFELEFIVPSAWTAWLAPGHAFSVRIDETGGEYAAEVTRLGGSVDPVSQSIKVYARILDPGPGLMTGMSGAALMAPPQ